MPTFTYGTTCIDYTIHYKKSKRDCTISVDWQTGVSVVVSEGIDQERVDANLSRKILWFLREVADSRKIKPSLSRHELHSSGGNFRTWWHNIG